jgi:DNA helicase-4
MILQARNALENGSAQEQIDYRHLLVDEFQDLNLAQIDLLRQLLSQQADSRLFAVGDDWQSIYGFKGARPDYFVNFDEQFAPSSRTDLETNYRCPPAVVEASSDLIKQNEVRISKSLYAASDIEMTPTVHSVPGTDDYQYERNAIIHAVKLIKHSLDTEGRSPSDILVLARNRKGSPFIRRISNRLKRDDIPVANSAGAGGVRVTTAHDAKGSEADHVLIVNAAEDREDGFPAMETERSLTQAVEVATESHIPEERRLFYVALTRAKEQLDIQTRTNAHSRFLREIQEHTQQRNILVNCQRDRISIELGVTDVLNSNSGWETRQLGTLERGDYQLKFAIPDTADDISLLKEGETYRFDNIQIGEYNGEPQFRIDEETTVIEPEPANEY